MGVERGALLLLRIGHVGRATLLASVHACLPGCEIAAALVFCVQATSPSLALQQRGSVQTVLGFLIGMSTSQTP